ncbi:biosynthetic-type acetolactate synthase large subunit [Spirochaeta cellobiosiphila]|uniref:biosynthetic-type acetolactate synthase large subunit n=1 Tax=Spirochaeta cellobiosiphila TaxID=504483 RepID=UPI00041F1A4F|nr:biosynthetic-type acetolactate synthase large subunit [Spirochaeta cellobiosiphila]
MERTGSQLIVEALKKEGVDLIFGYPGGAVIPIFDVLYDHPEVELVLNRHEQGSVHAADGYARATGKVGVCLATSGPGATNTITGLATANFDSIPIVCITGQVPRNMIGNDAFQEADTQGLTRPVSKHNYLVTRRADLGRVLKEAFYIAQTGRPGPVIVDIPKDVLNTILDDEYPEEVSLRGYNPVYKGHSRQIHKAAEALNNAQKPLFYIGGGMHLSGAQDIFRQIVDKTGIPVTSSLMGLGILEQEDPNFLGMIGMHGTVAANQAITDCDLLFSIGVRFDDRATGDLNRFATHADIIHIDIDPTTISRNVAVKIPIVGDARTVLEEVAPLLEESKAHDWIDEIKTRKKLNPLDESVPGPGLSPGHIIRQIGHVFPQGIICTEVGQNQMWTALFYPFNRTRSWLTSGGLGTMGYGFPAALGAQAGLPDKRVIDIAGDGSIQMNIQELATCVDQKLPVIIAILNNGYLGMVRQWQELFHKKRYSHTCLTAAGQDNGPWNTDAQTPPPYHPDFVMLAKAYGAEGIRVTKEEEIIPALEKAKSITDRPIVIDFLIDKEANVWPMVPPGAGLDQYITGQEA